MLIIGSVTLNLSTCYKNATCAIQREEGQERHPGSEVGKYPPHLGWQEQKPPWKLQKAPEQEKPRGARQQRMNCVLTLNHSIFQLALSLCNVRDQLLWSASARP